MDLFNKCMEQVEKCVSDAKMEKSSVDEVLLVGGSSRIPKLQEMLKEFFNGKEVRKTINTDEAVAHGAAVLAAKLSGEGNDNVEKLILFEVTPFSLGIEVDGDQMSVCIPRNTAIPTRRVGTYNTTEDNHTTASFLVYEGERSKATDNNLLGEFILKGIPAAPRGVAKFKVCFDIDENSILNVSAEHTMTGVKNNISNTHYNGKGRLYGKEREKMNKDAKRYKLKDEESRVKVKTRSNLEDRTYRMRNPFRSAPKKYMDSNKYAQVADNKNKMDELETHFNQTMDAGSIADHNIVMSFNEPTTAAIAYSLDTRSVAKNVLIFDLGGTFDVSVVTIEANDIVVKSIASDTHLGGEDMDNRMGHHFGEEFERNTGKNISQNPKAMSILRKACEIARRDLSSAIEAQIEIESLIDRIGLSSTISRVTFEELNMDLFKKCMEQVEKCVSDANMEKSSVHEVLLVGGSSRIPKLQEMLEKFFNGKEVRNTINPGEAVAYSAAVLAAKLSGEGNEKVRNSIHFEVTPLSLGIEVDGDRMLVCAPVYEDKRSKTTDNNLLGEFRLKGLPTATRGDIELKVYFGIDENGILSVLTKHIENGMKNTITFTDNQTYMHLPVYEGERNKATDNNLLGKFILEGIPAAPRGVAKFNVCFEIDENGIFNVSADHVGTGLRNEITITNDKGRLSNKEIERMIKDAMRYKLEDEEFKEKVKARSNLEDYAYKTRNAIRSAAKLNAKDKKKMEDAFESFKKWLESNKNAEVADYKNKMKELETVFNPIIAKMN